MGEVKEYLFEVEFIRTGQARKYGPIENEFIITNKRKIDYTEFVMRRSAEFVCQPVRFTDSPCWADSKETFEKIGDRKYRYFQSVPSTS